MTQEDKKPIPRDALTDADVIAGLRNRDPVVTRDYFYGICHIAYYACCKRYDLLWKPGMDFYSIAHEYYLTLDLHNFNQLEKRLSTYKLKDLMIGGFCFVVRDRLKDYNKHHCVQSLEERMEKSNLKFDIPDNDFSEDIRYTVSEICSSVLEGDQRSSFILKKLLVEGYKEREVAAQLGISPSAVTQRYHKLMNDLVIPYFKRYYVAPTGGGAFPAVSYETTMPAPASPFHLAFATQKQSTTMQRDYSNRITPNCVTALQPGEIFVFGSNLAGMHGGGAARVALKRFGAVLGNGDGPQGQSYAIPTMQGGVDTIRPYVDKFIDYAQAHPDQVFLVTPIGCGIAGFSPNEIAPLFIGAIDVVNIHLPQSFWDVLTAF